VPPEKTKDRPKLMTVAVPVDLANRLRVVAAHRDVTMTEMLDKLLRPGLDREYRKCIEAANTDFGGES
jgi:hypothetical protein